MVMDMTSMTLDWTTAGEVTIAIIQVITMDITAMEEITYTDIEEEDSHITIRTDGTTGTGIVAIITKPQIALLIASHPHHLP